MERGKDTRRSDHGCYHCGKRGHYARYCWYKKKSAEVNAVVSKQMGSPNSPVRVEKEAKSSGKKSQNTRYCWRIKGSAEGSTVRSKEKGNKNEDEMKDMMLAELVSWKLPQDVTYDILSRIPLKSVMQCRCVCKAWCALINNSDFINMHLVRSSKKPSLILTSLASLSYDIFEDNISYPAIMMHFNMFLIEDILKLGVTQQQLIPLDIQISETVRASCNGLLCLNSMTSKNDSAMEICNPFTRETVKLPKFNISYEISGVICGLGYLPKTKEYKVLSFIFVHASKKSLKVIVKVLTLGSNTWRSKGKVGFTIFFQRGFNVLVNGNLHGAGFYDVDRKNVVIFAFDIANEEFYGLPVPLQFRSIDGWEYKQIQELGGHLSLVDCSFRERVDIWTMKHYGVEESWYKQYVIPIPGLVHSVSLLWHFDSGEVLLDYDHKEFICYDPTNDKVKHLTVQVPSVLGHIPDVEEAVEEALEATLIYSCVHVGSLVSPRLV